MRRSALLGPLLLLGGCSGLGHFFSDTARLPGQNPNATTGVSENLQRSRGVEPATDPIRPQDGNVWPGPPQPLPTLSDVSHFGIQGEGGALLGGTGGTGGAMPRGGSMSMGEGESVRRGAAVDDGGFAGGGGNGMGSALSGTGLSSSVPDPATKFHGGNGGGNGGGGAHGGGSDGGGNIVIPNGDGTSTVISPDGSVKTVKGTPK